MGRFVKINLIIELHCIEALEDENLKAAPEALKISLVWFGGGQGKGCARGPAKLLLAWLDSACVVVLLLCCFVAGRCIFGG